MKRFTIFLLFSFFVFCFTFPAYAVCEPNLPVEQRTADCAAGLDQIGLVFTKVISVIVGLSFIVSSVVLAWAGIKYLTSGGEPKAIQAAQQALTWALLGILFLAIAWIILQLIQAVTGVQVTFFDIRALCGGSPGLPWCLPN